MSDLISRQAAFDALKKQMSDWNDDYNVPVRKSIENIERLPSAQLEPERGFWYPIQRGEQGYSAGDFRCSVCGQPNHCSHVTKYCCSCGAKMER